MAGSLIEFVFTAEPADERPRGGKAQTGGPKKHLSARERLAGQSMMGIWIACGVVLVVALAGWYFFLPLTYGYPGLSVEQVLRRKWLGYDLHFAK